MRKMSRRRSDCARVVSSWMLMPPTRAAASRAPMLVPEYSVGSMPRSSSACITPMCANPFMPPPPRTSAMRRECPAAALTVLTMASLQVLVQSNESDHGAADHHDGARRVTDDRAGQERGTANDHHRHRLAKPRALPLKSQLGRLPRWRIVHGRTAVRGRRGNDAGTRVRGRRRARAVGESVHAPTLLGAQRRGDRQHKRQQYNTVGETHVISLSEPPVVAEEPRQKDARGTGRDVNAFVESCMPAPPIQLSQNRDAALLRAVGVWGLAAGIVNITIGGGIFRLPAGAARTLGAAAPVAYLVCALAMGLIVLCFAEAG